MNPKLPTKLALFALLVVFCNIATNNAKPISQKQVERAQQLIDEAVQALKVKTEADCKVKLFGTGMGDFYRDSLDKNLRLVARAKVEAKTGGQQGVAFNEVALQREHIEQLQTEHDCPLGSSDSTESNRPLCKILASLKSSLPKWSTESK